MRKPGCLVCENEALGLVVDPLLGRSYSAKLVRLRLDEAFPELTVRAIAGHKRHFDAPDPFGDQKAPKPTDLAKLVVERTIESIESGDLEPTDNNWSNVGQGLAAQRVIEQRESRQDAKQLMAVLAAALMGGSPTGFLAPRALIGDGTIEGEYEEVEDGDADDLPEFREAFEQGRWDADAFCRLLGVKLHKAQKRMFRAYLRRDESAWRALYLWVMVSAGNRAGKTLGVAVIIMHACLYKMGVPPPKEWNEAALRRWINLPFEWYHFGVQQEVADIVFGNIIDILLARSLAQEGPCPLADMVGGPEQIIKFPWDKKYKGDYAWVQFTEFFGGAQVHFRSTGEKGLGSLGQNAYGVSFDEVGVQKQDFSYVINEVLDTRRLSTGGQFILISTPAKGFVQEWADLWYTGDPASPDRKAHRYSMLMSTRDNVGFGIDEVSFEKMIEDKDEDWIAQNIDGMFLHDSDMYFSPRAVEDCFVEELPERTDAKAGHVYLHGIDPALRQDASWSIVCDALILPMDRETGDITLFGVEATVQSGQQTVQSLMDLAITAHRRYGQRGGRPVPSDPVCLTAIDATGFGGKMFKQMLQDTLPDVVSVEFAGSAMRKRKLLGNLRTMIDDGRLVLPKSGPWLRVRRQLLGYKLMDRKIEQDAVMALAVLVDLVKRAAVGGLTSSPFRW